MVAITAGTDRWMVVVTSQPPTSSMRALAGRWSSSRLGDGGEGDVGGMGGVGEGGNRDGWVAAAGGGG